MGDPIAVFGDLELRRTAEGVEVLVDRVDGTVYDPSTTVDTTAGEAEASLSRSVSELVA